MGLRLLPSKCKKKFWGKPQNLVGICFTSEILGNFKSAVCVALWLFLGIGLLGTFLVIWKLRNRNSQIILGSRQRSIRTPKKNGAIKAKAFRKGMSNRI